MNRSICLSLLLLLCAAYAFAADPLQTFLNSKAVNPSTTSVLVRDLATGNILASHNAGKPLLPASIMKTVTIAGLLREAGPEERFHTRVYAGGPIEGAALQGDLIVVGGGDPTLGADCLPPSPDIAGEIVSVLVSLGVKKIAGGIVVDESLYVGPACPPSWAAADLREAYGTGSHALNFRRNAAGGRAVGNPERAFISFLASSLAEAGIKVEGEGKVSSAPAAGEESLLLLDHVSDTYAEVMRSCMMRSDNLFAETLLRAFALARGRKGSTADGASEMLAFWKGEGVPAEGVEIVDGSGLSRQNRVTAAFIAGILRSMGADEDYASFMPLAGQEGTLRDFLKDSHLDAYVAMKTGSMNGIQCYAGYKLDEEFAPTHLIVVIMNGIGQRAAARRAAEDLLKGLFPEP